jgi:AcrR family transcriptional regulator
MGNLRASRSQVNAVPDAAVRASPWLKPRDRARARDEKRDAVLTTAAQLFCTRGFYNTTLTDIARQLHITKPALYHYFSSKDAILLECTSVGLAAVEDEYRRAQAQGQTGLAKLEHFLVWYAENMTTVFGACLVRVAEQDLEPATQRTLNAAKKIVDGCFRRLIEQGIADGSIAPCDSKIAAFTAAGAVNWMGHWWKPGARLRAREAAERVVQCLLHGLANTDGSSRPKA